MKTFEIDTENRKQVREFLSLPPRLYRGIPNWVPPLGGEERQKLDRKRHAFFRHSEAAFLAVYRKETILGRLAVLENRLHNEHNNEKTAFFTLFECEKDPAAAKMLLEAGFDWARKRGLKRIFGPKGFSALDGLGLLVKGFERVPAMGQAYNPWYYEELIEGAGFCRENDIVSGTLEADLDFPERIHELAEKIRKRRGLTIARFGSRRELRKALGDLKNLYNQALEGGSGGTPMTDEEAASLARQMLWFADPRLIKIVMKDERPVGFLLAYPDISMAVQETRGRVAPFGWLRLLRALKRTEWIDINGAGMAAEFRGLGGMAILYSEMVKSVRENPRYKHAEVVQIGLENEAMQREMENFGVDFNVMHRTYSREI